MHIPGFEILEQLGAGGMATVWKARQVSLDRIVAIKVLNTTSDPDDQRRFQDEARSEAKLKHPGIVQVYDANVESGQPYIVMEFINGYTLGDWVRRKERLPETDALLVASHVAEALEYAWTTAGVIHCDIKPDNVMVDFDGTVKVSDLGLARSLSAMSERPEDDILGTPAYMSPEQIRGDPNLDFRTDVYGLGATLYHLLTGQMLFEGHDPQRIMTLQIEGQVPPLRRTCPQLSQASCVLVEKMLLKDPVQRAVDWRAVRMDLSRAKQGLLPVDRPLGKQFGTVQHARPRRVAKAPGQAPSAGAPGKSPAHATVLIVLAAVLGVLAGILLLDKIMPSTSAPPEPTGVSAPSAVSPASPSPAGAPSPPRNEVAAMLAWARRQAGRAPEAYGANEKAFRAVITAAPSSPEAGEARREVRELLIRRDAHVNRVMQSLETDAARLLEAGDLMAAAACFTDYRGVLEQESAPRREARARALREHHEANERAARAAALEAQQGFDRLLDNVAAALLERGIQAGREVIQAEGPALAASHGSEVAALDKVLADAADIDRTILATFEKQIGQEMAVGLQSGRRRVRILGVQNGVVTVAIQTGVTAAMAELRFGVRDLSLSEKWNRMIPEDDPAVALARGLMAWGAASPKHALDNFRNTHPLLRESLRQRIEAETGAERDDASQAELEQLARGAGIVLPAFSVPLAVEWLRGHEIAPDEPDATAAAITAFRETHGATGTGQAAEPFLEALEAKLTALRGPVRDEGPQAVVEAPAHEKIVELILRRNPTLNGAFIQTRFDSAGVLVSLSIASPEFSNASPLAQLDTLRELTLEGTSLESFGILRPLRLRRLTVRGEAFSDLRGVSTTMPLEYVDLAGTSVRQADVLRGLPLKVLNLRRTKVYGFGFLHGMKLEHLDVAVTSFRDTQVLQGMPLAYLDAQLTRVSDLSPLRGCPLKHLSLAGTNVRDLGPLRGAPLEMLDIRRTSISDLSPLEGVPLRHLYLSGSKVTDLSPLRGMSLTKLHAEGMSAREYEHVAGQPIKRLWVSSAGHPAVQRVLRTLSQLEVLNDIPTGIRRKQGRQ